ncbi:hypothetical protein [Deinococcus multiflagellatus]|uniref:Uncharacterized protein n=1 Tax=Deinococcus multiflagellatus TaxID=1656887 RepID=A0ABW1ZGH3_9DEIO|nr:hypothetical protein [Deinococcus multiflagellatus]MBZ9712183.1 hypothetical protein [Deinococcus multiflagellatus]
MTLTAPTFPLTPAVALQHLRDALGANYGAETDDTTLSRALSVDGVRDAPPTDPAAQFHVRPWATAARLLKDNTEYEVDKGLKARIDRKIQGLEATQRQMDALAGITAMVPGAQQSWGPVSGAVPTRGNW